MQSGTWVSLREPARQPSDTVEDCVQVFVVRRGRESTFRILQRQFASDPNVRVVWDRRRGDRRETVTIFRLERRSESRRTDTGWPSSHYVVVND